MTQKESQREKIKTALKAELKLDDSLDLKLDRLIRQVIQRIIDYCNREDLPTELDDTVISIVEDMLKADGTIETKQEVTSISRGGMSIQYRNTGISNIGKFLNTVDFVKDHESELRKYKKLRKLGITV